MNESRDTRSALLAAARKLFARHGYEGASIKAITSLAHANLGAVTYHFATKERLYHEVLTSVGEPFLQHLAEASETPGTALERIGALVRVFFEYHAVNRDMPSLMLHEMALNRPVPEPLRRIMGRIFGIVTRLVETGQKDGSILAGDSALLAVSVVAQPAYITIMRNPLREVAGLDPQDKGMREQIIQHMISVMRRSLAGPRQDKLGGTSGGRHAGAAAPMRASPPRRRTR